MKAQYLQYVLPAVAVLTFATAAHGQQRFAAQDSRDEFATAPATPARNDVKVPPGLGKAIRETLRKGKYEFIPPTLARAADMLQGFSAYEAHNSRHGFRASVGDAGLQLRPLNAHVDKWEFGLSLLSLGFEGDPQDAAAPMLNARENAIEFRRQGLVEWYVNDDRGLEQGFTLNAPPPRTSGRNEAGEVLELRLDVSGNLSAELVDGGSAVLLRDETGMDVLRVKHLFAFDATGRTLPAEFRLNGARLTLLVDARDAVYPVTIDPLILTEQAKLTASDAAAGDYFGYSVALDADTALVGTPGDVGPEGVGQGSAYVFLRSGTVWSLQAKLTSTVGVAGEVFGGSVAISGDTALVGAYSYFNNGQGSAYVFTRSGVVWSQQARLTSSDGTAGGYSFGYSVGLSGDTALVGAYVDDLPGPGFDQGSAYVFVKPGGGWSNMTQTAKLTASDASQGDHFGQSVAVSGDTALVGAIFDGSAYVFVKPGGGWSNMTQTAKLTTAEAGAGDRFGNSVALSGNTALVGAYEDDGPAGSNQGSAYVFTSGGNGVWDNGSVDLQQKLTANDAAAGNLFGYSVALSDDTALVGARDDDGPGGFSQGSGYVFTRSGTVWSQQAKLAASDGAQGDYFGISVALSGDTALAGSLDDGPAGVDQGSAYVFTRSGVVWSEQAKLTPSDAAASDYFGYSVALSGDTALVSAPNGDVPAGSDRGSVYVFVRSGTVWSQEAKLTASDSAADDIFGYPVALSGDTALVAAQGDDLPPGSNQGSVYVFVRSGAVWSQQAKLSGSDAVDGDSFGRSIALSGDTALVGAYGDGVLPGNNQGSAFVFVKPIGGWSDMTQTAKLTSPDAPSDDYFGWAVAISGDTALVGAVGDDDGGSDAGAAFVFTRGANGVWDDGSVDQQQKLIAASAEANDQFGYSVALSGESALVGAAYDSGPAEFQGSAHVFVRSGSVWIQEAELRASDGGANDNFGWSVALSGDTALAGAHDDGPAGIDQGSAYLFTRNGVVWSELAKLTASDAAANDLFGWSVALSGDTALVGAPLNDGTPGGDQGAAYVFTIGEDCNGNGIDDSIEIVECGCKACDCNCNGLLDECEIADCTGDPSCDDCDLNGVLDVCELVVCDEFTGECVEPGQEQYWTCPDNWNLFGQYPDDEDSAVGISVTLPEGAVAFLNATVAIPNLRINTGAELLMTATGVEGNLDVAQSILVHGTFTMIAYGKNLNTPPKLTVGAGGVIQIVSSPPGMPSSIQADDLLILGVCDTPPCSAGGQMILTDSVTLTTTGNLTLTGLPPEAVFAGVTAGITPPPKLSLSGNTVTTVAGTLTITGMAESINSSTGGMLLEGDFENQSVAPSLYDWSLGKLTLDGTAAQEFEVAGIEFGAEIEGYGTDVDALFDTAHHKNFSIGTLEIAAGRDIEFRNAFANTVGAGACQEALYVDTLILRVGSEIIVNDVKVYYRSLVIEGATFLPLGCGDLLPVVQPNVVVWDPTLNPIPWPNNNPEATSRSLEFRVTAPSNQTATPGQSAIKVTLVDLQTPNPANLLQFPPPQFGCWEAGAACGTVIPAVVGPPAVAACTGTGETNGCARWVGKPSTFYETQGPPLTGPYRAARLQCTPFYWDWVTETASDPITVVGAEIVPSSEYSVQVYGASCKGVETGCTNVSPAVTMYTRRSGDVDSEYNPPSATNQPNAIDVAQLVNKFKNAVGSPDHSRAQLQPNLPELNASVNALDIVAVVDAVKGFAYAFSGPCPCPSTVTCGGSCTGCAGMCVKTCIGGDNDGEPCINNNHCPSGACAAVGTCRDSCGRCN